MKINHYQVPVIHSLKHTMNVIRDLEKKTLIDKEFVNFVNRNFRTLCNECYPKLVHSFVIQNFKYKEDIFDEFIQAPYVLLQSKLGDCDDFSLFIHSTLRILNQNPKYIVFGKAPGKFTHIAVFCNGRIIDGTNANFNDWKSILRKYNYYLYP